jgi:hypothetical protein
VRSFVRAAGVTVLPVLGLACVAAEPAPPPDQVLAVLGLPAKAGDAKGGEEEIGRIVDVLVDAEGRPHAAVIDVGGFLGVGNRKVAVEWTALHFVLGKTPAAVLDLPADRIKAAPAYDPAKPLEALGPSAAQANP